MNLDASYLKKSFGASSTKKRKRKIEALVDKNIY